MQKTESELKKNLSKNILARRKELELSQAKLAELLDVDTVTISRLETGKNLPSLGLLMQISQKLNIKISDLLSESELENDVKDFEILAIGMQNLHETERKLLIKIMKLFTDHIIKSKQAGTPPSLCDICKLEQSLQNIL